MRVRRARGGADTPPPLLYSLSQRQAQALREAAETPGGAYVPSTSRSEPMRELVAGGAAEYREEHRIGTTTRSVSDPRPCEWTDYYIVPTAHGRALLGRHKWDA